MKRRRLFRSILLCLPMLALVIFSVFITSWSRSAAQGGKGGTDILWRDVDESLLPTAPAGARIIVPDRYRTVALNRAALQSLLIKAPMEFTPAALGGGRIEITLPRPDGGFARFHAEESPVMEPALAARHPLIRTYRAQGVDDPTATARFGITPAGFHAIILSPAGTFYIDPYRRGDAINHISYFKRDYPRTQRFECLFDSGQRTQNLTAEKAASVAVNRANGQTLRTYRLAFAANFEYSDFHSDDMIPDKAEVLAQGLIPAVNRINGIYEREVAVHMNLVANEDLIIFNTPADPYENSNGTSMLATNQATLDAVIGTLNYDIGHVASTGGGGVAFLGVVCSVQKAGGVTGLPMPTGDPYYVDYVAHEMGHQFGGNHTFNGTTGSCAGGNRNAGTAYEVGSGATIQAYAGICNPQDLQLNSDDYFHTVSYDEILTHITGEADACAAKTGTNNTPPTIEAGVDYNIPARTPFTLTATGSDPDGDIITYDWEQFDLGAANDGRTDNGSSPIFRSYKPTTNPTRTFPSTQYILNNANQPPATYPCGLRTCLTGELLPTATRALKFRVTARDNRANGGGVEYDNMQINVTAAAGPFLLTFPNGGETWNAGTTQTITWDVANTNQAPVSAANVDLRLSTDGGQTFPILLAAGVPNDGAHDVSTPAVSTTTARVRVTGSGNIFFDVSNANFRIDPPSVPPVAVNDTATTVFHTPVLIPVLANDNDPDGFPLSITAVQSPTNQGGAARVDDNGTPGNTADDRIFYTPPPLFSGADQFGYTVSDGSMTSNAIVTVTVNSFCPSTPTGNFLANFETGNNGFTVFTPLNEPASPPWTRVADAAAHSPTMSFFTDNAAVNGLDGKSDRLISPPQLVSSTSKIIFWHRFQLENDFDGGVLEVSTNGGASYSDILAVGGTFVTGGYNVTMGNGPLAGRMAWSNASPGWPSAMNRVEVNIGSLAGQTAIFRWHFRADSLNADAAVGWYVDDIQFTNLLVAPASCNEPPLALNQSVSTNEDTPLAITLTAAEGDGDSLTYTIETGPTNGTLSGTAPNVTYTPAANFNGTDSFTFRVSDGTNSSNLGTVSINVAPINDPPQAGDDAATVNQNSGANTLEVLRNDTDAPDGGEALTIQSVTQGANGTVVITNNGADLTYAPNAGFSGPDTFTYTVSDGNGGTATANVTVTVIAAGLQYYPLPRPLRLLDTRADQPDCANAATPLVGGQARTEQARVTCAGITIPAEAQAIVGNATVVNNTGAAAGFVILYPSDVARPTISNLNYTTGQIVPNAFVVGLAATGANSGAFDIYATSGINFVVDVTGYYAPPSPTGLYYHALPRPLRLLDTRAGQPACDMPGQTLTAGQARAEQARVACDGLTIPASARAIVGNATAVNDTGGITQGSSGFVTLYPTGVERPTASNLNYTAGQIVPNAFTTALGSDGAFNIYATESINFVVDVTGYYSDQPTDENGAGLFYFSMATPIRLLDTRAGQPACDTPGGPLTGGADRTQPARLTCGDITIPQSALAIVGNATTIDDTGASTPGATNFVTLYPSGVSRPTASNLNYVPGQVVPNMFVVGLGTNGAFNIYPTSSINFVVDVAGFFAP